MIDWAGFYSPLAMKNKKFYKDKGNVDANTGEVVRHANEFDLKGAFEHPFWEFKQDPEAKILTRSEAIKKIQALATQLLNEDKWIINDPDCLALVKGFETYGQRIDVKPPVAPAT